MPTVLNDPAAGRSDSIRFGPSAYGVERAEVYLSTRGFDPHRHDTYGIGVTTAGVQTFRTQDAVILGRRTYDEWAGFWPTSVSKPFASFINGVEKSVVTSTTPIETWANTGLPMGPSYTGI